MAARCSPVSPTAVVDSCGRFKPLAPTSSAGARRFGLPCGDRAALGSIGLDGEDHGVGAGGTTAQVNPPIAEPLTCPSPAVVRPAESALRILNHGLDEPWLTAHARAVLTATAARKFGPHVGQPLWLMSLVGWRSLLRVLRGDDQTPPNRGCSDLVDAESLTTLTRTAVPLLARWVDG